MSAPTGNLSERALGASRSDLLRAAAIVEQRSNAVTAAGDVGEGVALTQCAARLRATAFRTACPPATNDVQGEEGEDHAR